MKTLYLRAFFSIYLCKFFYNSNLLNNLYCVPMCDILHKVLVLVSVPVRTHARMKLCIYMETVGPHLMLFSWFQLHFFESGSLTEHKVHQAGNVFWVISFIEPFTTKLELWEQSYFLRPFMWVNSDFHVWQIVYQLEIFFIPSYTNLICYSL